MWSDGAVTIVDVERYLWGQVGEPLRDPRLFASFGVDPDAGTVTWPSTGFDISPVELRRIGRPAHRVVTADGPTATREQVLAARTFLRRLAADHDLSDPRVDATGAVVVTMPDDEISYRPLRAFAAAAAQALGVWVNTVAADAPGAPTDVTSL